MSISSQHSGFADQTLKLGALLGDIKIAHSIFALPFAACGLILSMAHMPTMNDLGLFLGCMVMARSFAMAMNRYLDRDIDAENHRTTSRAIPAGRISGLNTLVWAMVFALVFVLCSFAIRPAVGWLSLPLLFILGSYSQLKRFTWVTHWFLGACLGLAPLGAAMAFGDVVGTSIFVLSAGVMLWTAGFDLLYSTQDVGFDRANGLHSFPARFGVRAAVLVSRLCFFSMLVCLGLLGVIWKAGLFYWIGFMTVALLLCWQHWLVRDLEEGRPSAGMAKAFFVSNCYVSVAFYLGVQIDVLLR